MLGGAKSKVQSIPGLSGPEIREQLERILASEVFARSERLSGLLRYLVETTLQGSQHILKEQTIAQDFFGRGVDFQGATDPVVRVEARRLRDKLREYYASASDASLIITLPKGSYVPAFERGAAPRVANVPPRPTPIGRPTARASRFWMHWLAGLLAIGAGAAAFWSWLHPAQPPVVRLRQLSSLPGNEFSPSLSPDGNFVAFAWANGGPPDLYVKALDSESDRRLTDTPQAEFSPAWSPDGRHIAFVRAGEGVFVMSPLGGSERRVGEPSRMTAWGADSRSLLADYPCPERADRRCVYEIDLDTLEKRQVTRAGRGTDWAFAASPDGKTLAVVRNSGRGGINDVYLVPVTGGELERLTTQNRMVDSVAWTPDGRHVIYAVLEGMRFQLWRADARGGGGNGVPLTGPGEYADMPSVSRGSGEGALRIAYRSRTHDVGLRLVTLNPKGPVEPVGAAVPFADATEGRDCSARFSPDASQVAFNSIRTGESRIWLANRDGSGLRALTPLVAQEIKPGAWSPDGRRLVFDAAIDGNADIYITDTSGAQPIRLTSEPSNEAVPAWSPDGKWIYFASDRSGPFEIWKAPAAGGSATRLTFQSGFQPQPSMDGRYVYYVDGAYPGSRRPNRLKRVPAAGGEESVVLEGVAAFYWTVTSKGIHYLVTGQDGDYLERYDPASGERIRLGALPFRTARSFCGFMWVSHDGRYLIANHADRDEWNLRLIELSY